MLRTGIGHAIASKLLRDHHHRVVLIARTRQALDDFQARYVDQVEVVAGDLLDSSVVRQAIEAAIRRWERIDGLILNHGAMTVEKVGESNMLEWARIMNVNFFSGVEMVSLFIFHHHHPFDSLISARCTYEVCGHVPGGNKKREDEMPDQCLNQNFSSFSVKTQIRQALPHLRASRGRIIFVSSGAAVSAYSGWGAYGASKAAVNHLAMTLAVEEPDVVSVVVRPGIVDTEMQRALREDHFTRLAPKDQEKFSGLKKDGKLLQPEQPGNVIARLALEAGKDLTGKFLR